VKAVLADHFMVLGAIALGAMIVWELVKIVRQKPRKPHDE